MGTRTHTKPVVERVSIYRTWRDTASCAGPGIYPMAATDRRLRGAQLAILQLIYTATSARCWAIAYGVACLSIRGAKAVFLSVSYALPLGVFVSCLAMRFDHSGRHRQSPTFVPTNPYKTRVSVVELGRISRDFLEHFEKSQQTCPSDISVVTDDLLSTLEKRFSKNIQMYY